MKTIVASDAGASEILSFFAKKNKNKYNYLLKGTAKKIFKKNLGKFKTISLKESLKKTKLYICGTGWQSDIHIQIIKATRLKSTKVIAYLDHWVNYKKRFIRNRRKVLPDMLISSDKNSYKISKKIFKKTTIIKCINYYEKKIIEKIKKLKEGEKILYFLEPFNNKIEFMALKIFFQKLKKLKTINKSIILKIHPSEKKNKYIKFLKKYENFKVVLDNKSSIEKLISSAKYIFGLESNALAISQKANKKVFTILPLYNRKFRLPFKKIKNINKFKKF